MTSFPSQPLEALSTNTHTRLRPRPSSRPRSPPPKAAPTTTLSLATAGIAFPSPSSPSSCVPFPANANDSTDACGHTLPLEDDGMPPRRVRARTSHVATPKSSRSPTPTATSPTKPPLSPRKSRSKHKRTSSTSISPSRSTGFPTAPPTPLPILSPADLRLIALIERSISSRLMEKADAMDVDTDENEPPMPLELVSVVQAEELDDQDKKLASKLRATLARHGWRSSAYNPPRSPPLSVSVASVSMARLSGPGVPPSSSLAEEPSPSPALRFVLTPNAATTSPWGRPRSGSTESSGSITRSSSSPMSGIVARVMLRRAERGRVMRGWEERERLRLVGLGGKSSGLRTEV